MIKTEKWNRVCLREIADEITERVNNPSQSGFKIFVGLEHFVSGDLKIKQWGSTKNLVSAMKIFQKGDILFARRNAYLKRASIAEFDGVCSGDAFVIREKKNRLVPGFLTFIFNSESLWNYANSYAAGTMSKRVKWRDLSKYSFKLPPLDEQKRLAELLWSMDEATERKREICKSLATFYTSFLEETCKEAKGREKRSINDICNINKNNLPSNTYPGYEFRYLDITSIIGPNMLGVLKKYFFKNAPSRARRMVEKGNIVLSLVRPYHQAFVLIEEDCKDLITSTGTAVLEVSKKVNRDYLFHIFFSRNFLQFCEQRMTGTNYPAITPTDLKQYKVFLPSLNEQGLISKKLSLIKKIEKDIGREIDNLVNTKKQIINQIFG